MSLIVEDGSGVTGAESYISVANAITYCTNWGYSTWLALTTAQQEQSLRQATTYMISEYRMRWKGRRVLITQGLDWPRVGVVLEDFGGSQGCNGFGSYGLFQISYQIVPPEVMNACVEFANRFVTTGTLNADLSQNVVKETVGPIDVTYDKDSPQYIRYRQIDNLLAPFMLAGGNKSTVKLIRC